MLFKGQEIYGSTDMKIEGYHDRYMIHRELNRKVYLNGG